MICRPSADLPSGGPPIDPGGGTVPLSKCGASKGNIDGPILLMRLAGSFNVDAPGLLKWVLKSNGDNFLAVSSLLLGCDGVGRIEIATIF